MPWADPTVPHSCPLRWPEEGPAGQCCLLLCPDLVHLTLCVHTAVRYGNQMKEARVQPSTVILQGWVTFGIVSGTGGLRSNEALGC